MLISFPTTHYHISSYSARYTFSGKERDEETGYSYFGARYYNSSYSIWLSVDPMADKYPSLSPYAYCGNNPVKLVDPNGEDYDVVVNDENMTITIRATYYTANENKEKLQQGLDAWNSQSGKYSFEIGEREDKRSYTINFELTIASGDFETTQDAVAAMPLDGSTNLFSINDNIGESNRGIIQDGKNIMVKSDAPDRTTIHEIGHSLGIGHFSEGVMQTGGDGSAITIDNISSSIKGAGMMRIGTYVGKSELEGVDVRSKTQYEMFGKLKKVKK